VISKNAKQSESDGKNEKNERVNTVLRKEPEEEEQHLQKRILKYI